MHCKTTKVFFYKPRKGNLLTFFILLCFTLPTCFKHCSLWPNFFFAFDSIISIIFVYSVLLNWIYSNLWTSLGDMNKVRPRFTWIFSGHTHCSLFILFFETFFQHWIHTFIEHLLPLLPLMFFLNDTLNTFRYR